MRSSVTSNVVLVTLGVGLVSIWGCSVSDDPDAGNPFTMTPTAGSSTTGGSVGQSGSTNQSGSSATTAGSGGASATAGSGGASTTGGISAGGATGGSATGGGGSGTGGSAGNDITKVWPSDGKGKAFAGGTGNQSIMVTVVKAADCAAKTKAGTKVCGSQTLNRTYNLRMPQPYDPNKSYPLLFEGPGCGGNADSLYQFPASFLNTIIRVGLQPSKIEAHGTNPGEGCFDDKEGDDSLDWGFYEALYDKLNAEVSFDRNRVFSAGNSSGSWFSNELGCKYAGDAKRPVRGVMPNTGGLPVEAAYVPTCTMAGMAGMWVHEVNDGTNSFAGNIVAIDRAMKVNKCTKANYAAAEFEPFPVSDANDTRCKRIKDCDPKFPLVVCPLPGNGHGSHPEVVEPGFPKFMGLFNAPPLLTP